MWIELVHCQQEEMWSVGMVPSGGDGFEREFN